MRATTALLAGALLLPACAADPSPSAGAEDSVEVAAGFYPLEWLAGRLGGPDVSVTGLTAFGSEPHSVVLGPTQREAVDRADVVLYLGLGFQPDVERAVDQLPDGGTAVDLLDSPGLALIPAPADLGKEPLSGGEDPHVWLDPVRLSVLAERTAEALVEASPELAEGVQERLDLLQADLAELDAELERSLRDCRQRTIVTSHAAFGYLADRYDLGQVAISGLSPDDEPDPAALRDVAQRAEAAGVSTVFFEEALSPDLADTVADEIGAGTDVLGALEFDPAAEVGQGEDYLSVMRRNGASLTRGLDCDG